ncbi:BirA family transcriptional regulator, biotin operon repressor / biotin-[acetyl-CoA-carboxylase] ligase [Devosia lucknowensis]|uniref:biotin--[biotin carboxyl-carrier protein] ligase n=1 Tax=Devosia lucknowensis TaxID=1096929 RepID=A0A1Y6ENS7_9HYPH|nr:biotin--[acetyl-CoA-carboxylase] ligase [Devosia lucknowensis]SMQ64308.1 BirA family transcriptional regulator, biotin operon repressor / biotin-[acetyl-CoA-carboxylase] ligase [Devosia lucknowensis]
MSQFVLGPKARDAGYRVAGFDAIGSTNSEALDAVRSGDPGGIWFAAAHQTAGRGRRGRQWHSVPGNLAASLLIVPDASPDVIATLGFVAGVALNRALASVLPQGVFRIGIDGADGADGRSRIALKWPNDVLADGAKLSGILLESTKTPDGRTAIVIGCGVNVVAAPADTPYPATSLRALGVDRSAEIVFEALSDAWVEVFGLWDDGRGVSAVLDIWRGSAAGIGAPVAISQDGVVRRGIFETIDSSGRLIIRDDDGARHPITAGDVHFGATASARS